LKIIEAENLSKNYHVSHIPGKGEQMVRYYGY